MTLDFVSHMTHLAAPSDLSTYPYAVAALDTPLNGAAAADKGASKKDTSDLAPFAPAEASIFPRFVRPRAPSLSLPLPLALSPSRALALTLLLTQSYPDINLLIWLFAFRYRRLLRHPSSRARSPSTSTSSASPARLAKAPYARVNWAGMSLNAYYAAVRRALLAAVLLRATAALGGLVGIGLWIRGKLLERSRRGPVGALR